MESTRSCIPEKCLRCSRGTSSLDHLREHFAATAFGVPSELNAELDAIAENGRAVGIEPSKTLKPLPLAASHRRAALQKIDFVVISHRHADHTSGITYLLTVNPKVKIYVPDEPWGLFARGVKNDFYRKDPSLPADMRYYGGHPPEILEAGTPWPGGNFVPVSQKTEVAPGLFILPGVSTTPGTLELKELSLAIKSPQGVILIVGCSHPGVEHILQETSAIDPHVHILLGGLHQIQKPDPEVERIATVLHDQYKVDLVAPGHCTGEPEFAALKKTFGDHYVYAGAGTVIELSRAQVASSTSSGGR